MAAAVAAAKANADKLLAEAEEEKARLTAQANHAREEVP